MEEPSPNQGLINSEIFPRLERIKKICGPLCEIDSKDALEAVTLQNKDTFLPQVRVPFNCQAIMESADIDAGDTSAPYPIPNELQDLYSLSGAIRIRNWSRFVNLYLGGEEHQDRSNKWDEELLAKAMEEIQRGAHEGTYGINETTKVRDHLRNTGKIQAR